MEATADWYRPSDFLFLSPLFTRHFLHLPGSVTLTFFLHQIKQNRSIRLDRKWHATEVSLSPFAFTPPSPRQALRWKEGRVVLERVMSQRFRQMCFVCVSSSAKHTHTGQSAVTYYHMIQKQYLVVELKKSLIVTKTFSNVFLVRPVTGKASRTRLVHFLNYMILVFVHAKSYL